MNTALWTLQGLLFGVYLAAGLLKLFVPKDKLITYKLAWAEDFAPTQIKLIGLAELLGAIGVIVPWATGIAPILTPIAAACLVVIMGGAVMTHLRRKEPPVPALPLGLFALLIAIGRGYQLMH